MIENMLGHAPVTPAIKLPATKEIKLPKEKKIAIPKVKLPKEKKIKVVEDGKGGWAINPNYYGTGLMVESFYKGQTWIIEHDTLVDAVNKSLKAKGKLDLFEQPRGFYSSAGLRSDVTWRIKE